MAVRKGSAQWKGTLKDGSGTVEVESGTLKAPYSFSSRFEEGAGTNPEELIAAAHAGCFSMAFSLMLTQAGFPPQKIDTTAKVHLEKKEAGFEISRIELATQAVIPEIDENKFQELAENAKNNCPVSKALQGPSISLDASLV